MTKPLLDTKFLQQLKRYDRLIIGYSGGLDSTVLLHSLSLQSELTPQLTAIHINHGLSPNALEWQKHCERFCDKLRIPLIVKQIDFKRNANIEDAARRARYAAFMELIGVNDCLILAHHINDQAETLLLHLLRGTGIDGLAGMADTKKLGQGQLLRPLLHLSRATLESYANSHQLLWIDDESNEDIDFSRNYLRHQIIPLLVSRWPKAINNFARTSDHCQQAQANLEDLAIIDCPDLKRIPNQLSISQLTNLSKARLANVLRVWLRHNQIKLPPTTTFNRLITEMVYAKKDANPQVIWEDVCVRRYQERLYLLKEFSQEALVTFQWSSFPKPLDLGRGLGTLSANLSDEGLSIPAQSSIEIRFRQGGEVFCWHGQTKALKKLFQEWRIPPWLRDRIPLVYINQQLACIVGYAISDRFYVSAPKKAYQMSIGHG
ncbi:tRNA lysidine(34) synthetase TilS [Legionella brunensis]|uniref:tRNA lysidine(34) synthetase TilS n=1 Tax=Legionella brunensis TaxID=29422 RepID=UPI0008025F0F|nr:tRNA lysidine(34) synthetase TilS [Legionella brunensis]